MTGKKNYVKTKDHSKIIVEHIENNGVNLLNLYSFGDFIQGTLYGASHMVHYPKDLKKPS